MAITVASVARAWQLNHFEIRVFYSSILFDTFFHTYYDQMVQSLSYKIDPRNHVNWKQFESCLKMCDKLGVSSYRYFQVIFYRLLDDGDWKIFPNVISSTWAKKRFKHLNPVVPPTVTGKSISDSYINSLVVAKSIIESKMAKINLDWKYPDDLFNFFSYSEKGSIYPVFINYISKGFIPKSFLSICDEFNCFYGNLNADIKDDIFSENQLDEMQSILLGLFSEKQLQEAIKFSPMMKKRWRER